MNDYDASPKPEPASDHDTPSASAAGDAGERKEGALVRVKYFIQRILYRIAGVDVDIVRLLPERSKNLAIRVAVIFLLNLSYLCVLASFALDVPFRGMFEFAGSRWVGGTFIGALLSSFDIMLISSLWVIEGRIFLTSELMERITLILLKYTSVLARVFIAILMSLLLSTFVMIKAFDKDIAKDIVHYNAALNAPVRRSIQTEFARRLADLQKMVIDAQGRVAKLEDDWKGVATVPTAAPVPSGSGSLDLKTRAEKLLEANDKTIESLTRQRDSLISAAAAFSELMAHEENGDVFKVTIDGVEYTTSGRQGRRESYARFSNLLAEKKAAIDQLSVALADRTRDGEKLVQDVEKATEDASKSAKNIDEQKQKFVTEQDYPNRLKILQDEVQKNDNERARYASDGFADLRAEAVADGSYQPEFDGLYAQFKSVQRLIEFKWENLGFIAVFVFLVALEVMAVLAIALNSTANQYAIIVAGLDYFMLPEQVKLQIMKAEMDNFADLHAHAMKKHDDVRRWFFGPDPGDSNGPAPGPDGSTKL